MEVSNTLNVKTEPISDEEITLVEVEFLKNEAMKTSFNMTREAVSPEEGSSVTVSDFKIKEEKYDELQKKLRPEPAKKEAGATFRAERLVLITDHFTNEPINQLHLNNPLACVPPSHKQKEI
ncbi:uncharacterized protein LOC143222445 [Tachypleus tridentatus]|uniref:uncharacterized protein LOC143222445 n=1 Tax=Tachypleus tridentatus TaxID=6853 RepID=UPI003FD2C4AC